MLNRRTFISSGTAAAVSLSGTLLPGRLAFGAAPTENRLAVVILRGGLDGLDAVPPYADRHYRTLRPTIAVPPPGQDGGAIDLNGGFGLHPSLAALHDYYRNNQLLIMPAATTNYRARSHFDGQNLLENGSITPYGAQDGWLNRALLHLNDGDRRLGLAVGSAVPLILRGNTAVRTWSPSNLPTASDDFLARLGYVYAEDPLLSVALRQGIKSQASAAGVMSDMPDARRGPRGQAKLLAQAAGRLLAKSDGPRVAVLEVGGWDTHTNQANRLRNLLRQLAEGLQGFHQAIGPAWQKTVVVVVSEFGRTVAENGSRGTDHGVGGIAMLLGGAVNGGRIVGKWPGLAPTQLFENRDLAPANDYREIFKSVLHDHLGLDEGYIEDKVFPGGRKVRPMANLVKRT
jgi:uncharacterized protein (DUF1501 family)